MASLTKASDGALYTHAKGRLWRPEVPAGAAASHARLASVLRGSSRARAEPLQLSSATPVLRNGSRIGVAPNRVIQRETLAPGLACWSCCGPYAAQQSQACAAAARVHTRNRFGGSLKDGRISVAPNPVIQERLCRPSVPDEAGAAHARLNAVPRGDSCVRTELPQRHSSPSKRRPRHVNPPNS